MRRALLVVSLLLGCRGSVGEREQARTGPAAPLERVVVLGASVSAGFSAPRVGKALDAAITAPHVLTDVADAMMFRAPGTSGRAQVDAALAAKPSLVVAIDFLFWYVYGQDRLELGLGELERLGGVPVFVGDVPDMRGAAAWMLPPEIIPSPGALAAANERIRAWASAHPNVRVLPMSAWTAPLLAGGTIVLGQESVPARALMALDGLHPNLRGLRYVLLELEQEIEAAYPGTARGALELAAP